MMAMAFRTRKYEWQGFAIEEFHPARKDLAILSSEQEIDA